MQHDVAAEGTETRGCGTTRPLWRRWQTWAVLAAVTLAGFLLYRTLSRYSMEELVASVAAVPMARLLGAAGFAAASYLCLTGFDFLALRYVGRPLPYPRVALASFISLSIGHNIGVAFLSSGAVRYRFYSRWGLGAADIAKVILFCGVTVGLGLATLGGIALLLRPGLAQDVTGIGRTLALAAGIVCVCAPLAYLGLTLFVHRPVGVGRWQLAPPRPPLALAQIAVGAANFACVAGCLHQALSAVAETGYLEVAAVYVIANVTALISHVPGGLGVIESVVAFLMPHADLIGALLVFRFVYFLAPLVVGLTLFGVAELVFRARSSGVTAGVERGRRES